MLPAAMEEHKWGHLADMQSLPPPSASVMTGPTLSSLAPFPSTQQCQSGFYSYKKASKRISQSIGARGALYPTSLSSLLH